MTLEDIYNQTKLLSTDQRRELLTMLAEDLTPELPNTIRSREQLIEMLHEGMKGELHPVTKETFLQRQKRIILKAIVE